MVAPGIIRLGEPETGSEDVTCHGKSVTGYEGSPSPQVLVVTKKILKLTATRWANSYKVGPYQ